MVVSILEEVSLFFDHHLIDSLISSPHDAPQLKYFRSGLDFLVDQTLQQRDWISFLQMAANNSHSSAAGNNRLMAAPHDEEQIGRAHV